MLEEVDTAEQRPGNSSSIAPPAPETINSVDVKVIKDTNVAMLEEVDTAEQRPGNSSSSAPPASETIDRVDVKVVKDTNVAMLEEVDTGEQRPGNSSSSVPPASKTMDPVDVKVIKEAIQKLLGDVDVDYVAPTNPTRTPAAVDSRSALTPKEEAAARDSPIQSYNKLLGQLVDYAQKMDTTENPISTQIARMLSNYSGTWPSVALTLPEDPEMLRNKGPRKTRPTTTTTTTTTRPTANPLCTHDYEVCQTMCFDEHNYRVTCTQSTTPATSPRVDVSKLMYMLAGLIQDYETNLTDVFNETLIQKGYEPCPTRPPNVTSALPLTTTTGTTETVTENMFDYTISGLTGNVIAKCYVCGLLSKEIPQDAHCSDAFPGDFVPVMPEDHSARGKLGTFRKRCKYMDMIAWHINGTGGREMWGKWTGGCSVRWIDISGVYTQRTCRSRYHPVTGDHFVSKRMAKLEKALTRVDNGCIASPMASLVPFSRGVSLFARFHACVCTGSFCNRSSRLHHALLAQALIFFNLIR